MSTKIFSPEYSHIHTPAKKTAQSSPPLQMFTDSVGGSLSPADLPPLPPQPPLHLGVCRSFPHTCASSYYAFPFTTSILGWTVSSWGPGAVSELLLHTVYPEHR